MRDEALVAVRARLDRIEKSGDLALALEPDAVSEVRRLALLLHADLHDTEIRVELGRIRWYRAQALPQYERRAEETAAIKTFTHCLRVGHIDGVPPELLPRIAQEVSYEASRELEGAMNSAPGASADAAVALWRRVVRATPLDSPAHPEYLSNLATALHARYLRTSATEDLHAALDLHSEVLRGTPLADYRLFSRLSNYAVCLMHRWESTGDLTDLDTAVEQLQQAVSITQKNDPRRFGPLIDLGKALSRRSALLGTSVDSEAAVAWLSEAARIAPPNTPEHASALSALGTALHSRYRRLGTVEDADRALKALREAVESTPPADPARAGRLADLGAFSLDRFSREGERFFLEEALEACDDAVAFSAKGNPNRARHLSSFAGALRTLAAHDAAPEYLDKAILWLTRALEESAVGHPDRAQHLTDLGAALHERFFTTLRDPFQEAAKADLDAAIHAWTQASEVEAAPARQRILAAWSAARQLAGTDPDSAADLAEAAVRLLPRLAPRRLDRGDRQHGLGAFPGLASEAASLTLAASRGTSGERAARALRLLETGRAVLLGQALDARGDLTELRRRHPETAARFMGLREQLDRDWDVLGDRPGQAWTHETLTGIERSAAERQKLAAEFTTLLEQIRNMPDFASFGLPPALDDLLSEAEAGAVVILNVSRHRSDALTLTGTGVDSVQLPELTLEEVSRRNQAFRDALLLAQAPGSASRRRRAQAELTDTLEWLWDVAAGPVLDGLGHREQPTEDSNWPRVWWVPSGPLTQLPLHAAGHHADEVDVPGRRTVMDRVVSSYTPTVRALRHAREQRTRHRADSARATAKPPRALIVAMPTTPGHADLEHVLDEVAVVRQHLREATVLSGPDQLGEPPATLPTTPTRRRVLERLADCAVAHFACHGESDREDPSSSRLLLCDHNEAPLTVARLAAVHLDRAELAYLSACRTTVVETGALADEPIHLTTALQIAGFPHVIGTLWEIDDETAVTVADAFYRRLRTGDGVDSDGAAYALRSAIRALRDRLPRVPSLWAAHLHAGA